MSSVRFSKGVAALGILTILSIVILLATPAGAWAQGVIGNLEIANSTSESQPGLTDHRDGRMGEVPPAYTDAGEQITTEGETNIEILTGTNVMPFSTAYFAITRPWKGSMKQARK